MNVAVELPDDIGQALAAQSGKCWDYSRAGTRKHFLKVPTCTSPTLWKISLKNARQIAKSSGLKFMGILGIVEEAAKAGLVDLPHSIEHLRSTNFKISTALTQTVLAHNPR